ncbi:MAG: four helix bundle protein [Planctomycetes bacterium]|nr:four helix bundle protein [Planctomycetota bacterium]
MPVKQTFRDLKVWRKSIGLAKLVYETTKRMPESERFGLTNQMRRAAVSIPSNIAEGNARQTRKNYIHFLIMARGSLAELETQLIIAQELKFLPPTSELMESIKEVSRMLQGLITSLRQSEKD